MAFEAEKHLISLRSGGKPDYLETKWRIVWFRQDHPRGCISTETLSYDPVMVKASVYDGEGAVLATAHAGADASKGNPVWKGRSLEKAETAAVGRALAMAGFGTQFVGQDLDDGVADSPAVTDSAPNNANGGTRPQNGGSASPQPAQAPRKPIDMNAAKQALGNHGGPTTTDVSDDLTNKDTASDFIKATRAKGISDADVLAALGVTKLSEWTAGRKAAGQRVKDWQAGKLADNDDVTSHNQQAIYEAVKHLYEVSNKDGVVNQAGTWKHVVNAYNLLAREGVIRGGMSNDQVIAKLTAYKSGTPVEDMKQFANA